MDDHRRDFIREIIDRDLDEERYDEVVTRFPPEPNGYLHIGHAKSICLNFGIAGEYGGRCHLRFDDTNPLTEDEEFVASMERDIRWLGFDWSPHLYHASDYFDRMYSLAQGLIRDGKAYVDSQSESEIRENRGTVTEPGVPSPYRDRSVEENLDLFERMKNGEFEDGAHVLRAKIDLAHANMIMRDPVLYRIRKASHYRQGDRWSIYPLYDYAHCLEDAIEGVTHSLCTLEFENNREIYDWLLDHTGFSEPRPHQYEFARLNIDYTVMSKRKLRTLVEEGVVSGWDDPRMPTLAGLRRRGVTPEAIRTLCDMVGVTRVNSRVDYGKLEYAVRDDLNSKAPRVMGVVEPLRVVLTEFPETEEERVELPSFPRDVPRNETRTVPLTRELFIERNDFRLDPPTGFRRLAVGREVRLKGSYIIRCDEVVTDDAGEPTELRCTHFPETKDGGAPADGRKVRGTIHWVSASEAKPVELRLYDHLFTAIDPDDVEGDDDFRVHLNPESLSVVTGYVEPSAAELGPGAHVQFERVGYFFTDPIDSKPGAPVFNRVVELKAPTEKKAETVDRPAARDSKETPAADPVAPRDFRADAKEMGPEVEARFGALVDEGGLSPETAIVLAEDPSLLAFYREVANTAPDAQTAANWIVHELRGLTDGSVDALPFSAGDLADLLTLIHDATLSSSLASQVLEEMMETGDAPGSIVEKKGLAQISDASSIAPLIDEVLSAHPDQVEAYRGGKESLIGFFMGQVMRRSGGKANPEMARNLILQALGNGTAE